jgi:hypothetical protein
MRRPGAQGAVGERAGVAKHLESMIDPVTRGDPESPLCRTRKITAKWNYTIASRVLRSLHSIISA